MKQKIILTTNFTAGDVLPFIRIGKILKERGHQVVLFSHVPYGELAQKMGLDFVAWETPDEYEDFQREMHKISDPLNRYTDWIDFKEKFQNADKTIAEYQKIVQQIIPGNTLIVARHRTSLAACFVSEKMKVPMVTVYLAPSYLTHLKIHEEMFGKVLRDEINEPRKKLGLPDISSWFRYHASIQKNIGLWPDWFASRDATWSVPIDLKGFPLLISREENILPRELNDFIGDSNDILFIAGGSSDFISPQFFNTVINACELLNRKAIVCTPYRNMIPGGLPDSVFWIPSVPYPTILPRVRMIIHHGGMGTISEALAVGIPQLILAHVTDGPDNASRIEKIGAGKFIPQKQWHPETIAQGILELDKVEARQKCRNYGDLVNKTNMIEEIADYIANAKDDPASIFTGENPNIELPELKSLSKQEPLDQKTKLEYQKKILLSRIKKITPEEKIHD